MTTPQANNKSGFKGVSWHEGAKKWRAQITIDGRQRHLGYFDTPTAASDVYLAEVVASRRYQPQRFRSSSLDWMLDNPEWYRDVYGSIHEHPKPDQPKLVVLCFECMSSPRSRASAGGVRCGVCDHKRNRRMKPVK